MSLGSKKRVSRWSFLSLALVGIAIFAVACPAADDTVSACLITKTDTNPFFVKMKEGAQASADDLGIELTKTATNPFFVKMKGSASFSG